MNGEVFVYFIECGEGGPIKIGKAKYPIDRTAMLQTGTPFRLRLLGVIRYGGKWTEGGLHKAFAPLRMRGEWFQATPELLSFIKENAESPYPVQGALPLKAARTDEDDMRHLGLPATVESACRRSSISSIAYLRSLMELGHLGMIRHIGVAKIQILEKRLRETS